MAVITEDKPITNQSRLSTPLVAAGLSICSAILLIIAFPNFEKWYLAWIAFVPLLVAITIKPTGGRAFLLGELFGSVLYYGTCYWITYSMINYGGLHPVVAYAVTLIPVLVNAIFTATFAAALAFLLRKFGNYALLSAPFIWAGIEFLRLYLIGIGWNSLGYSQGFQPAVLWPASYGGVYLVSALIILVNAALALAICHRTRLATGIGFGGLALLLGIYLIGAKTPNPIVNNGAALDVIAVQAVAPVQSSQAQLNQSLSMQIRLTVEAVNGLRAERGEARANQPILVVWPEAPYNFSYDSDDGLRQDLGEFSRRNQIYLMINAETDVDRSGASYNSVVTIGPSGERVGQYDKIHLLPFGEYVPLRNYLPFIDRIPSLAGDYTPASKYTVINIEGKTIGTFICFESVFPDITREMSRVGATTFINVANDGWFGPTPITRQHLAKVTMRAAETASPIMRVTNTGITANIAANGQVSDTTPIFQPAVRRWQIADRTSSPTFYVRYGDLFAICSLIITTLLLIAGSPRVEPLLRRTLKLEK